MGSLQFPMSVGSSRRPVGGRIPLIQRLCSSFLLVALFAAALCLQVDSAFAGTSKKHPAKPHSRSSNMAPLPEFELGRYQYCGNDKDCVLAQNGCCDCANGGQDIAINKDRAAAFQARFNCLHVNCGDKIGDPVCASGVISCVNHKCKYFSDAKPKPKPTPVVKKKKEADDDDDLDLDK